MSQPNHTDVDNSDNEIINNAINTFLQNITNPTNNNSFLDTDDSNTFYNEAFMSDTVSTPPPPQSTTNTSPTEPPQEHTFTPINAVGILPLNHPNVGSSLGNRYLVRPTLMSFRDILPNGTYGIRRYVNVTPSMINQETNTVLNSVIQHSFNEDNAVFKEVISDGGKNMLKPVPFSTLDTEETNCTIMQEPFDDDTVVVELPCKHVFCEEAIMHWLENESASCPVCRTKLPSKEIRIQKNIDNSSTDANVDTNVGSSTNVGSENVIPNPIDTTIINDNRQRSSSAPTPLNNNVSEYYYSIINNITRVRNLADEEDTQRAIWNSIANV
jgi:hypothetical protein